VLRERLNAIAMPALVDAVAWSDAPPAKLALFSVGRDSSRLVYVVGMNPDLHIFLHI
jgi:hypothetical protein